MIIGIDVDEVLADMNDKLNLYHNENYNTNVERSHYKTFDLTKTWNCTREEADNRFKEFLESHHFKKITPKEGAEKTINILKNQGHELIIITARGTIIHEETITWLNLHFKNIFSKIHFAKSWNSPGKRKWEICLDEKIEIMIDDGPHIIRDCSKHNIKSIIMDAPWNQNENPEHSYRVKSWKEALTIIEKINLEE